MTTKTAGESHVATIQDLDSHPHRHLRHDSKVSISTKNSVQSTRSHKEYLDTLVPPSNAEMENISRVQEKKENEVMLKRVGESGLNEEERRKAAIAIQRNYRGHRERRMLNGMSLDPTTRWVEAIKEAQYRKLTEPRARNRPALDGVDGDRTTSTARQNWKKIGLITRRAGGDEDSDEESGSEGDDINTSEQDREARRKKKLEEKMKRQKKAKVRNVVELGGRSD